MGGKIYHALAVTRLWVTAEYQESEPLILLQKQREIKNEWILLYHMQTLKGRGMGSGRVGVGWGGSRSWSGPLNGIAVREGYAEETYEADADSSALIPSLGVVLASDSTVWVSLYINVVRLLIKRKCICLRCTLHFTPGVIAFLAWKHVHIIGSVQSESGYCLSPLQ